MKKSYLLLTILSAIASGSVFAQAGGSGEVKFTGTVIEGACSIKESERNKVVPLGSITKNVFKAAGDKSQMQPFSLTLTECTWDSTKPIPKVAVTFSNTLGDGTSKLVLNHPTATAKGVAVRLFDQNGSDLDVGVASTEQIVDTQTVTLPFYAAVEAVDATVTPGTIDATAKYVLSYK